MDAIAWVALVVLTVAACSGWFVALRLALRDPVVVVVRSPPPQRAVQPGRPASYRVREAAPTLPPAEEIEGEEDPSDSPTTPDVRLGVLGLRDDSRSVLDRMLEDVD